MSFFGYREAEQRSWMAMLDGLQHQLAEIRSEQAREREFWAERVRHLEGVNARLREELLVLNSAAAQAQLAAYRQQRRMPPEPTPEIAATSTTPADLGSAMYLQDHYADGVRADERPSESDEELERQVRAREEARLAALEQARVQAFYKEP